MLFLSFLMFGLLTLYFIANWTKSCMYRCAGRMEEADESGSYCIRLPGDILDAKFGPRVDTGVFLCFKLAGVP